MEISIFDSALWQIISIKRSIMRESISDTRQNVLMTIVRLLFLLTYIKLKENLPYSNGQNIYLVVREPVAI